MTTYADDVAFLCRELDLSGAVVLGHSLGGMIAIELAARHPSLVGAVVAVDPGPIDPLPRSRHWFDAVATHAEGPDGEAVRLATIESNFLPTDDPARRRRIVETMASVPLAVAAASFRAANAWNGVGALMACRAPLLVLLSDTGGSNDPARLRALKAGRADRCDGRRGTLPSAGGARAGDADDRTIPRRHIARLTTAAMRLELPGR